MLKRAFIKTLAAASVAVFGMAAQATEWPQRPITLVLPFAPGGSTDTTARLLAEKLRGVLGQMVNVENKAGAGGNIGAALVAKAAPDGYTLLMHTSTLATNASLYEKKGLGFDMKALMPVSQVALIPNVLMVNNDMPAKNLQEFVDYVRARKAPVNYGSAGNGSSQHLSGALFNSMARGDMQHVPYKGGAPANADLMAGQIQAVFSPLVEVLGHINGGKLRPLGITTETRSPRLPDVPAIGESLPGYSVVLWNGVFAPAGTPPAVIDKLHAAIAKVLQDPAVQKTLAEQGSKPVGNTPEQFKQVFEVEIEKWGRLVQLSGARVD